MEYVLDTHSHTLACGHAYNTIREMAEAAAKKGLELLAITDHTPMMPGGCHDFYFHNLRVIDRNNYPVELMMGAELNIYNSDGAVDLPNSVLKQMDIVIASMHIPCYKSEGVEKNTQAYINAMKNPYIHIIGHPDDGRYPVDYEALVKAAKEHHVLLELNNSSLDPQNFRQNCEENALRMLQLCKKHGTMISLGSDAHVDSWVGRHDYADKIIKAVDFPEELIINSSVQGLKDFINNK